MPKFFELSVYTIFFYFLTWVLWLFLVNPADQSHDLGSLAFLPHAGRVLPVLFFGGKSIPAIFFAEYVATNYIGNGMLEYSTSMGAIISSCSILLAWAAFKVLDVDLKSKKVLRNTDWKHVTLFIFVSALINGIANGAYYLYTYEIFDPLITIRFAVGDIVGSSIVILSLMFLTGWIKIPNSENND